MLTVQIAYDQLDFYIKTVVYIKMLSGLKFVVYLCRDFPVL